MEVNMYKDWLTTKDLSEYLQVPESKINFLVKAKQIPYHDGHGFLRFNREEIDEWMKLPPVEADQNNLEEDSRFIYRGKPIKEFMLAASRILLVETPWKRLPDFIKESVIQSKKGTREYLLRTEFDPFIDNFDDYLRVSCQLGLIEKQKGNGKMKHYYPSEYAKKMHLEKNPENIKKIILDSVLSIVKHGRETEPDERHAIFLLWYILKIREEGLTPEEHYFWKGDKVGNYYPKIRLSFAKSLHSFLFNKDKDKEQAFLNEWNKYI